MILSKLLLNHTQLSLVMFNFLIVWFLANYSYDNLSSTYKTYHSENPIQEMTSFIEKHQYREDQLRNHCNLQNFKMKEKPTYYDRILDTVRHGLTTTLYKGLLHSLNYPGLESSRHMNATTFTDFMNLSYNSKNDFIVQYIFPGIEMPELSDLTKDYTDNWHLEDFQNFGQSYAKTLRAWKENVGDWSGLDDYDTKFRRMWDYYLLGGAAAFQRKKIYLWQFVYTKKTNTTFEGYYIRD